MCSPPNKDFWYTIKKVHSMESYYSHICLILVFKFRDWVGAHAQSESWDSKQIKSGLRPRPETQTEAQLIQKLSLTWTRFFARKLALPQNSHWQTISTGHLTHALLQLFLDHWFEMLLQCSTWIRKIEFDFWTQIDYFELSTSFSSWIRV